MRKRDLSTVVAFVTDCSHALGRAVAAELSHSGAAVAVAAADLRKAQAVADSIREQGGRAIPLGLDICDDRSIDYCVHKTVELLSGLHVLVNSPASQSTATYPAPPISNSSLCTDHLISGLSRTIFAVVPHFRAQKSGRILTISSHPGGVGRTLSSAATNGAVAGLTQALAVTLGLDGININAICCTPSPQTTLDGGSISSVSEQETILERGRAGELDVAQAAVFLVSDYAYNITGQTLYLPGNV